MNTRADARAKWLLYKELELIPDTYEETLLKRLDIRTWIGKAWELLSSVFAGHSELRIWSTCDRTGTTYWHCYDPISNRVSCFSSEAEVMAWIERRYYEH